MIDAISGIIITAIICGTVVAVFRIIAESIKGND